MFKHILYANDNGIAKITLNRPEFGNAFAPDEYAEIGKAIDLASNDSAVRVVIVTGAGKNFSAGGDINRFKRLIDSKEYLPKEGVINAGAMATAIKDCAKPVIAMINGAAAGAGAALAMACDFRVMSEKSKLATSFIGMGFSGDTGLIYFLIASIGVSRTTELLMLPKPISAKEAYDLGICNRVAVEGELESTTMELANKLANQPTQAITRQKKLLKEFFFKDLREFNAREAVYMCETGRTQDHEEAVNAFLGKRPPVFKGQ